MTPYKIPLLSQTTDQFLNIELDLNPYILRVLWNERGQFFTLSIYTAEEVPILIGIKMVKNYSLIKRFKNTLLPPGDFYFIQENGKADRPLYDDLEKNFNLYYVSNT